LIRNIYIEKDGIWSVEYFLTLRNPGCSDAELSCHKEETMGASPEESFF